MAIRPEQVVVGGIYRLSDGAGAQRVDRIERERDKVRALAPLVHWTRVTDEGAPLHLPRVKSTGVRRLTDFAMRATVVRLPDEAPPAAPEVVLLRAVAEAAEALLVCTGGPNPAAWDVDEHEAALRDRLAAYRAHMAAPQAGG